MKTAADFPHLPMPDIARVALRKALAKEPDWPEYRRTIGSPKVGHLTRAQWIEAALHFGIDIEAFVADTVKIHGTVTRRRYDMDGTDTGARAPERSGRYKAARDAAAVRTLHSLGYDYDRKSDTWQKISW